MDIRPAESAVMSPTCTAEAVNITYNPGQIPPPNP